MGGQRDLTTLEYYVLGLISVEPQSGYSIITYFEMDWYRWRGSSSPGSIYPILKRLESQGIIDGELETIHETRPRKVYTLTPLGEELLNVWLRTPVTKDEAAEERATLMMKFLFAEKRLSREEVLAWLQGYEEATAHYITLLQVNRNPMATGVWSTHQQLILEATLMELNMQRTWIQMARQRLLAFSA
ncbi:MAG: PadR family transcriptional regulator [Anaerolineae bacterium]|nr:PadR family transcriptional regulator [Anaerolineae bacterium]